MSLVVQLGWDRVHVRPIYRHGDNYYNASTGYRLSETPDFVSVIPLTQDDLDYGFLSEPVYIRDPVTEVSLVVADDLHNKLRVLYSSGREWDEETINIYDLLVPLRFEHDTFVPNSFLVRTRLFHPTINASLFRFGPLCILEITDDRRPVYVINNHFQYDAVTLERVEPAFTIAMGHPYILEDLDLYLTKPVCIITDIGYYLMQANGSGQYHISRYQLSDYASARIESVIPIEIPDTDQTSLGDPELLVDEPLPEFDGETYRLLMRAATERWTMQMLFNEYRTPIPQMPSPIPLRSPRRNRPPPPQVQTNPPLYRFPIFTALQPLPVPQIPTVSRVPPPRIPSPRQVPSNSTIPMVSLPPPVPQIPRVPQPRIPSPRQVPPPIEPKKYNPYGLIDSDLINALIARLYQVEIETPPQILNQMVPFERAIELFKTGKVIKYLIDPSIQVWSGPIGGPNRIMTLFLDDGTTVLTKVKYEPKSNQIFPPI